MCGVIGIFSSAGDLGEKEKNRLEKSLTLQNHRGPDAQGIWMNRSLAFGHNRLSIIDLSHAADQPFYREDLGLRIIFNGEIYNFQELKRDLILKGYVFFTSSDTEVILAAYAEFGKKVCEYLTGMFAFSIYNERTEELFLARDRFGEKPIFYIHDKERFYWASELNSLRTLYHAPLTINHRAVVDLLEYAYIHLHHTIYNEVNNFPPASYLIVDKKGNLSWDKYYAIPTCVNDPIPFEDLKKITKEKLYSTIERELVSDVPVATFLSGGVDSALITAVARDIKHDLTAVTMSTNEGVTDETEIACQFTKQFNIYHEIVPVSTDSLEVLENLLKDVQPISDASLIPSHLVTEHIKDHFTVMLSGDGGDEIFGSYNKPNLFLSYQSKNFPFGGALIDSALNKDWEWLAIQSNKRLNDSLRMKWGGWKGYYSKHQLSGGLRNWIFKEGKEENSLKRHLDTLESQFQSNPEKLSFGMDFLTKLPAAFLFKVDTASMHSSVEVRAPYLDHSLVDFLMKVPTTSLMPNGIDKELSKALLSDFTGKTWYPPKRGFTIPYWEYLRGPWGEKLESYLMEGLSEDYFNLNKNGILVLLKRHRAAGSIQLAKVLFTILVLEIWLRVFHLSGKS